MTDRGKYRESELPDVPPGLGGRTVDGRRFISVIGIDRYQAWPSLDNAVNDARGALAAFEQHGFISIAAPLLNEAATRDALHLLPSTLRPELDWSDSLVVFFAGHGYATTDRFPDGHPVTKGYLIPADAAPSNQGEQTWERLEHWLTAFAELRPRHILVILDSCHSGIALNNNTEHRGSGVQADSSLVSEGERRSRRVLASAAANERATDGGPITGHSVFTGYLIEALRGGNSGWRESSIVGMREVAEYVGRRIRDTGLPQTPKLRVLEFDASGELFLSFGRPHSASAPQQTAPRGTHVTQPHRVDTHRPSTADRLPFRMPDAPRSPAITPDRPPAVPARDRRPTIPQHRPEETGSQAFDERDRRSTIPPHPPEETDRLPDNTRRARPPVLTAQPPEETCGLPDRTEGWTLDPGLAAALDRHGEERRRGAHVLTIVAGDAMPAQTSWGTWAARHGYLTLATESVGVDTVVADLLAQTPWLRCVPAARRRLAATAQVDVQAVDASLDARSNSERRTWIDDVARLDPHARVSGWLLSWLRGSAATVPDPATAPVPPGELLAIACDLASPTAVLLFHPTPNERWLEHAIVTAAELISYLPAHSVAVTAPEELVRRVVRDRPGAAGAMARQGVVSVAPLGQRLPGRARHSTMRVLFDALARDPRTRGRFEFDSKVAAMEGPAIDVALVAHRERIAVELDAWYHFHDPEGYRRDRVQDARLQRSGYFVLRFPAEDVDDQLASTIEHLAIALAGRRAARALP
jgi:very-short-patch-repair endonuclease